VPKGRRTIRCGGPSGFQTVHAAAVDAVEGQALTATRDAASAAPSRTRTGTSRRLREHA